MESLLQFWMLPVVVGVFLVVHVIIALVSGQHGYAPGWQLRCTSCNATRDASEAGVVRIGAASVGKRTLGYCRYCQGLQMIAIERSTTDG